MADSTPPPQIPESHNAVVRAYIPRGRIAPESANAWSHAHWICGVRCAALWLTGISTLEDIAVLGLSPFGHVQI